MPREQNNLKHPHKLNGKERRFLLNAEVIYKYLKRNYQPDKDDLPEMKRNPKSVTNILFYYRLDDLIKLMEESGLQVRRRLKEDLELLTSEQGTIGQETFVRLLDKYNQIDSVVDYCLRN